MYIYIYYNVWAIIEEKFIVFSGNCIFGNNSQASFLEP